MPPADFLQNNSFLLLLTNTGEYVRSRSRGKGVSEIQFFISHEWLGTSLCLHVCSAYITVKVTEK